MNTRSVNITVRPARTSDAEVIASVYRESWRQAYTGIIPALALERALQRRDVPWWRETIRNEANFLVLDVSGTVVGYATCGTSRHAMKATGEIYELYVAPAFQGIGLGEHLFEACRSTIDRMDLAYLVVWALSDNSAACAFYRRCGGRPLTRARERFGTAILEKTAFVW